MAFLACKLRWDSCHSEFGYSSSRRGCIYSQQMHQQDRRRNGSHKTCKWVGCGSRACTLHFQQDPTQFHPLETVKSMGYCAKHSPLSVYFGKSRQLPNSTRRWKFLQMKETPRCSAEPLQQHLLSLTLSQIAHLWYRGDREDDW